MRVAEGERLPKAVRIVGGLLLMAAFVLICLYLITRYAGYWGVPMFSFRSDNDSVCTNDFTGYTCNEVSLADVEFYGEVDLPDDSTVVEGTYTATHDYTLDVTVEVPKASAAAALKALNGSFGPCRDHVSPLDTRGLTQLCAMTNDDVYGGDDERNRTRLYSVGTGVRKDGIRVITISAKSR